MNRNLYLAGAISCYFNTEQHDYPKQWREEVKEHVKKYYENITITSPTDFYEIGKNDHKSESEVMRFDLRMVREADVILVNLKDLYTSLGTSDEIFYAFIKGKPIIGFLDDDRRQHTKYSEMALFQYLCGAAFPEYRVLHHA